MAKVNDWMDEQRDVEESLTMFEPIPEPTPEPIPEPISEPVQPKVGVVTDCSRLNVRVSPRAEADVVCVIDRESKVVIDEDKSTRSFYKVCTEVGVEGYCMKQFINVLN